MRPVLMTFCLLVSTVAFSQNSGGIFGLVSDRDARLIDGVPIDVRNVGTGAQFHAASGPTGHYRVSGLTPGEYELSINDQRGVLGTFVPQRIKVADGDSVRLDIIVPIGRSK